ncbi:Centrosomal protein of 19 kDa [Chamberlinius hualienensis]
MESNDIVVKKCGVQFQPPCIILFYETTSSKLRRRTMPLHDFNELSDVSTAIESLKRKHKVYLTSVPSSKLEELAKIIQTNSKGLFVGSDMLQNEGSDMEIKADGGIQKIESSAWDSDSDEPFF